MNDRICTALDYQRVTELTRWLRTFNLPNDCHCVLCDPVESVRVLGYSGA